MFISRPIQWYHSHADPIWAEGTFTIFQEHIPNCKLWSYPRNPKQTTKRKIRCFFQLRLYCSKYLERIEGYLPANLFGNWMPSQWNLTGGRGKRDRKKSRFLYIVADHSHARNDPTVSFSAIPKRGGGGGMWPDGWYQVPCTKQQAVAFQSGCWIQHRVQSFLTF